VTRPDTADVVFWASTGNAASATAMLMTVRGNPVQSLWDIVRSNVGAGGKTRQGRRDLKVLSSRKQASHQGTGLARRAARATAITQPVDGGG
jgi:hypothetical protein